MTKLASGEWNGVAFIADDIVNYFNNINKSAPRLHYTRDAVRTNAPVFFFNEHSIFTWIFSRKIEMCLEAGLINHWSAHYKHTRKRNKHKEPKKLGINSILAMLEIAAVLYLIAFITFILEVMSHKCNCIQRFLDYLTY